MPRRCAAWVLQCNRRPISPLQSVGDVGVLTVDWRQRWYALALATLMAGTAAFPLLGYISRTKSVWRLAVAPGATILAQGDSLTYGQDTVQPTGCGINGSQVSRSRSPYPDRLQHDLPALRVVNEGYPGDRTLEGLSRWRAAPSSAVTIIMYGTNDALSQSAPLSVNQYRRNLADLIRRREAAGSKVVVLLPPMTTDLLANWKLTAYRHAAARAARETVLSVQRQLVSAGRKWGRGFWPQAMRDCHSARAAERLAL
jgi:lysophospholipase L1-like esterase